MSNRKRARRYAEKSVILNARVTPHIRVLLERTARRSGRTLSAETEFQLQRALSDMTTGSTYAIMTTIGRSIESLVKFKPGQKVAKKPTGDGWLGDPYLFEQARQIVLTAFEFFRPGAAPTSSEQYEQGGQRQGQFTLEATLREMQLVDTTKPFAKQTEHERWLNLLRMELGDLLERPHVWGQSAEQARTLRDDTATLRHELISLLQKARKVKKAGDDLSPDERARLAEIQEQLTKTLQEHVT